MFVNKTLICDGYNNHVMFTVCESYTVYESGKVFKRNESFESEYRQSGGCKTGFCNRNYIHVELKIFYSY